MNRRGYFYVGFATTLNIILNALTFGRFIWLEGRVRGGVFNNWGHRFRYKPRNFVQPTTEEQIISLVKNSKGIRFFGAGHSFNDGVVADEVLVSLDNYSGLIWKDLQKKQLCVKGGTRVRDVVQLLLNDGLAFEAQPSHDAQSIGGILSTDVHGTGKDWGFVSASVVSLKVIDGLGDVHNCVPTDDLFKAAIGGIGAVGIISEVVVQGVDRFNIDQRVEISDIATVKKKFNQLLQNKHFSLYLFPFTDRCQINTWNPTTKQQSFLNTVREFLSISIDALLSAWFGGFMAVTGLLPKLSTLAYSFKRGTSLVMESNEAYNRTIYHLHQELEFTVPFEQTFYACERFIKLFERMYEAKKLPYTLFEVRFTPAGHNRTLLGAGRDRASTWIDLVPNDSDGFEEYYAAAEELMKEIGARPHLGKFCKSFRKADMAKLHGDSFTKFLDLMHKHDPQNKFANDLTRRLFRD